MRKFITEHKIFLLDILTFINFFAFAFTMFFFSKHIFNINEYGLNNTKFYFTWLLFSLSWVFFILLILKLIPNKYKFKIYVVLDLFYLVFFISQIVYAGQLDKFMMLSDLFVAGEGLQYIKVIFVNTDASMVLTVIFNLFVSAFIFKLSQGLKILKDKTYNIKLLLVFIIIIILTRVFAIGLLGKVKDTSSWRDKYNARNIYNSYNDTNASMYLSGYFEYTSRSVYKYFYNLVTLDKKELKKDIDEYNKIYGKQYKENEYTGLFKDKNVVYVMMESIDSWILDETTMPNLYRIKTTGWNFTKRYSPFFNGGQTINSEFSLNSGLYSIIDKETIYDLDDISYPYSLPSMLNKNGYYTSSFHANTSSFYNRENFHKLLGYNNHYSALDMQREGILNKDKNYFSDSVLLADKKYMNYFGGENSDKFLSFFTTYSAHLQYTKSNKVYKDLKNIMNIPNVTEEENIYRSLAKDTDIAIGELIDYFEDIGKLDNTVFVFVADHYVYGYSDPEYVAAKKGLKFDRRALQNTPFIIWTPGMEHKDIDIICDTADILPTMFNLLGIKYNPNNYIGEDIFSDTHDNFVWFSDGSNITGINNELSNDAIRTKTEYNISKNKSILLTNYYGAQNEKN